MFIDAPPPPIFKNQPTKTTVKFGKKYTPTQITAQAKFGTSNLKTTYIINAVALWDHSIVYLGWWKHPNKRLARLVFPPPYDLT